MRLEPGLVRFGVAPEILVPAAQWLADRHSFGIYDAARALGAPIREVEPVLCAMQAEGFIEEEAPSRFVGTAKLNQLANAKISAGLSRAEADALLARVLEKARQINSQPDVYPCCVGGIVVFGSYLSEQPVLGDLDLGVHVIEPRQTREESFKIVKAMMAGRSLPADKTYAALRLRQPKKISVHALHEVIELGTPFRVVFGELPPDPRSSRSDRPRG